jgi:hypothetical protein
MNPRKLASSLAIAAAAAVLTACAPMGGGGAANPGSTAAASPSRGGSAADDTDTMTLLFPSVGASAALQSGCWATFYEDRNFGGDATTLVGPIELRTLDRGSARQLRREMKSIVTGPRATLVLFERQFLSARSVGFPPSSREPGLIEKLGFGGRIESMRLQCS